MKTVSDLRSMKEKGEKVTWITAYEYASAYCAEQAGIDMILVGDSGGMTVLGYPNTQPVSVEEMITLTKAARRGAPNTFIVGDMPFGSYEISPQLAVTNALRFIKEGGCQAIKLEGASPSIRAAVEAISQTGITVFGHLGLTPQTASSYRVQGKTINEMKTIQLDACNLVKSGASFILLEAMPERSAEWVAKRVQIPVYGIGAGARLDGQLLIYHDLVGYYPNFKPRFAKNYVSGLTETERGTGFIDMATSAIRLYIDEVKKGTFPSTDFIYPLKDEALIGYLNLSVGG